MSRRISLTGPMLLRREASPALPFCLQGQDAQQGLPVQVAFLSSLDGALPDRLERADIDVDAANGHAGVINLFVDGRPQRIEASRLHVHRDLSALMHAAIPPRDVPLNKRVFWRVVLWLARSGAGRRLLMAARR